MGAEGIEQVILLAEILKKLVKTTQKTTTHKKREAGQNG